MKARLRIVSVLLIGIIGPLAACSSNTLSRDNQPVSTSSPSPVPSLAASKAPSIATSGQQTELPYRAETMIQGLNVPWDMAFAPDGRIFLTERPGTLRMITNGKLVDKPMISFPAPFVSKGEGGLLGLALDPEFAANHYLYVYHTYLEGNETKNRVLRLLEKEGQAQIDKVLLDGIPGDTNHNGGRIRFGPDGLLYITAGERYKPALAQDPKSLGGKILRIARDGSIPSTNPFPGTPVYSWGHRNPQGLAWHPVTGKLFSSEHGQKAHDEINIIEAGANYGWPLIEGDQTGGKEHPEFKTPILHSGDKTWAPSGIAFITQGPWKGSLLVANLKGTQVLKVTLKSPDFTTVSGTESLFSKQYGRIRSVTEGPDGSLYLLTNNRDGRGTPSAGDDRLIRLKPAW